MSSHGIYFPVKSQPVALPEIPCPAMELISQENPAGRITRNSTSGHGIYLPVKSSQYHYQKFHLHPWDLFFSQIKPVALLEIPPSPMGLIFQ